MDGRSIRAARLCSARALSPDSFSSSAVRENSSASGGQIVCISSATRRMLTARLLPALVQITSRSSASGKHDVIAPRLRADRKASTYSGAITPHIRPIIIKAPRPSVNAPNTGTWDPSITHSAAKTSPVANFTASSIETAFLLRKPPCIMSFASLARCFWSKNGNRSPNFARRCSIIRGHGARSSRSSSGSVSTRKLTVASRARSAILPRTPPRFVNHQIASTANSPNNISRLTMVSKLAEFILKCSTLRFC